MFKIIKSLHNICSKLNKRLMKNEPYKIILTKQKFDLNMINRRIDKFRQKFPKFNNIKIEVLNNKENFLIRVVDYDNSIIIN